MSLVKLYVLQSNSLFSLHLPWDRGLPHNDNDGTEVLVPVPEQYEAPQGEPLGLVYPKRAHYAVKCLRCMTLRTLYKLEI